ncbi:hypothetical protein GOD54_23690 [Sinorhizobium medicae]|nr:hypothetical protein [Sinorhizobium medicae]
MAYAEPFRLRVLKNLTAALEEISKENGYHFDLAGAVFRGRDTFSHNDPIPMLSILESILEKEQLSSPPVGIHQSGPWELLIQGWTEDDECNPTDPGQYLMADVKQRLVMERQRGRQRGYDILGMEGKITDIKFSTGVVRPPDEVSSKAYFWLKLELVMVENLLEPFA